MGSTKEIEVITSQQVRISYELAAVGDRIMGLILDLVALAVISALLELILSIIGSALDIHIEEWVEVLIIAPVFFLYTPIMELFNNGQSLGKVLMRTKVIAVNGKNPELIDILIRWAFRILDIWFTLGSLGILLITSSGRAQRLGGRLSNTAVVRLSPRRHIELEQLMRIDNRADYSPQFPSVRLLEEHEMLALKSALDRYRQHRNEAHLSALVLAAERVKKFIDVDPGNMNVSEFIERLIQDYVVLTR
jgi:uncharacterized RDD family membrane protein YckC